MVPVTKNGVVLYSSKMIAAETRKLHKNVIRDIREVIEAVEKDGSDLSHQLNQDVRGYTSEILVDRTILMTVLTGYSTALRLKVVQRMNELEEHLAERNASRLESADMVRELQEFRAGCGKDTAGHHYSNEYNMINRIVLGATAKKYREEHGIDAKLPIRDALSPVEIAAVADLQRVNTSLIAAGLEYAERKERLMALFMRRYNERLTEEILALES